MHPASSAPATIPVMLETSSQTSCLGTRCARSPKRTVADSARRNTHPPVDGLPFVAETVGCLPDSTTPQQMPRVAWLPLRPMQWLGQLAPVRQPERDADNDRKRRNRVPAVEPREGRSATARLPARRRSRSSHGTRHAERGRKSTSQMPAQETPIPAPVECPASRGKTPASRCARRARKWRPGVRRPARKAAAFRNCRKEHRKTNFLQRGEPTDRGHAPHLEAVAPTAFAVPSSAGR